jgi:hypothetical protein
MPQFIATNIFMLSFGSMLYIAARALPRLDEEGAKRSSNIFERLMKSGIPERVDAILKGSTVKFLRKTKVYLLKIENSVTLHLRKMSEGSGAPFAGRGSGEGSAIDFKEILEEKESAK